MYNLTNLKYDKYSDLPKGTKFGWFTDQGYLYFAGTDKLKHVLVKGIWENLEEIENYCGCDQSSEGICFNITREEYPLDPDLTLPLYKIVLEFLMRELDIPEDLENNAIDRQIRDARQA